MCRVCALSDQGRACLLELGAATGELAAVGLTPQHIGDFPAGQPWSDSFTGEQQAAIARYSAAMGALTRLHLDYEVTLTRTVKLSPQEISHCVHGLLRELQTYRSGGSCNREQCHQIAALLGKLDPEVFTEAKVQELLEGV